MVDGVAGAAVRQSVPKPSQSANQPVSKLISQPATQTAATPACMHVCDVWTGGVWSDSFSFHSNVRARLDFFSNVFPSLSFSERLGPFAWYLEWNIYKLGLDTRSSPDQIIIQKPKNPQQHVRRLHLWNTKCKNPNVWVCVYLSFPKFILFSLHVVTFHICA